MSSSSHDWQIQVSASPEPEEQDDRNVPAKFRLQVVFALAVFMFIARYVRDAAVWLFEDDDLEDFDIEIRREMPQRRWPRFSSSRNVFDKKKMLRPYFGQTFKVMRVGIK
ncbi:hypothetical protein GUITHDRAFT_155720 [Guillardia theta CCMP2712]|uniref:Uncharacterized protein n=1 Tax=Guillardia theta (strain CCMP2712) TaxID=905079 RepID=L1IEH3_GUITC|nr:hypothetical protein GUITHDRAFT_155720 [Guillardia theta CCMP2712]EKX34497.1 hypothetical protein GUITHDRAFT_155720 [Guillardia theta CCMP2712]|eukprot:XP_005821477.1 hypothetical protein GUITHDRAFT_155720 [Guillardia theta CCMP2712]